MVRFATIAREIFIPIPKVRDTNVKIEINDVDVTKLIDSSKWIKPSTLSRGSFTLKLKNAGGRISNVYSKGQTVKCYLDNTDATTLQFRGRIDYPKDILIREGQWLEIEGRHRSYLLSEIQVCHSTNGTPTDTGQILKDIMDKYASDFTYTNVNLSGIKIEVEWNYVPFMDCLRFLCKKAVFDAYVDDDLDMHYFEQGSIFNSSEAIIEGDNFLRTEEIGTDDYYEKTRVIAIGKDDEGIPIIHTAISIGEGNDIREVKIQDNSADTYEAVKALAEAELDDLENRPVQAIIVSYGLETINSGDKLWIVVPRQGIYNKYRVIQVVHKFSQKEGWTTESTVEKEILGTEELFKERIREERMVSGVNNINKLDFSYNFKFDDDNLTITHDQTRVSGGLLELSSSSYSEGTWVSKIRELPSNATFVELRYVGKDLEASKFYFRFTGNEADWQEFGGQRILKIPKPTGKNLQVKINLIKNDANPWPIVKSGTALYS